MQRSVSVDSIGVSQNDAQHVAQGRSLRSLDAAKARRPLALTLGVSVTLKKEGAMQMALDLLIQKVNALTATEKGPR
jgi:hypothetical protein